METLPSHINKDNTVPSPIKIDKVQSTTTTTTTTYTRPNHVSTVMLYDVAIVCLWIDGKERLCLAQISNTLLKDFSYNEIHNRRVALGITCVQCTPVQLEILRRAGAMPVSSRRCGMITKREAERLVKSFLEDIRPPKLPEDFTFDVVHCCGWGCKGDFYPSRYNSSRAKCVKCKYCNMFFSANKFIFHYHRLQDSKYSHPDAANFNSWRRHLILDVENTKDDPRHEDLLHAWEDVKAMFNGGSRKRVLPTTFKCSPSSSFAKLQRHSTMERKVPIMNKHNSNTPLVIEPTVPAFYKPQPQKFPIFNQALYPSYHHPNLMHCQPASMLGMSDSRQENTIPRGDTLYPSYEMIWAKHLGLPHLSEALFPMSTVSKSLHLHSSKPTPTEEKPIFSPKQEFLSIEPTSDTPLKSGNSAFSVLNHKDIFRPYALEERQKSNTSPSKSNHEKDFSMDNNEDDCNKFFSAGKVRSPVTTITPVDDPVVLLHEGPSGCSSNYDSNIDVDCGSVIGEYSPRVVIESDLESEI